MWSMSIHEAGAKGGKNAHSGARRFSQLQSADINMLRRNDWTNNNTTNKGTTYLKTNFWNEKIKPAVNKYLETDQSNN